MDAGDTGVLSVRTSTRIEPMMNRAAEGQTSNTGIVSGPLRRRGLRSRDRFLGSINNNAPESVDLPKLIHRRTRTASDGRRSDGNV